MSPEQWTALGGAVAAILAALGGWRVGRSHRENGGDSAKAIERAGERIAKAIENLAQVITILYPRGRE